MELTRIGEHKAMNYRRLIGYYIVFSTLNEKVRMGTVTGPLASVFPNLGPILAAAPP